MENPVIEVQTRETKPIFRISNYRMVVHAILISLISCIYGGTATMVLLVIGAVMIYDNINRHSLSYKVMLPFFLLVLGFFFTLIVNFITTMEMTFSTILIFFSMFIYISYYIICLMFNFDLIKEIAALSKDDVGLLLNVMSSSLGFICIPVVSYAIVYLVPAAELYVPLIFVAVHLITSPNGNDPILISFAAAITLISSVFCYIESKEAFIVTLPLGLYTFILTQHFHILAFIAVPVLAGSCASIFINDYLIVLLTVVIAFYLTLLAFKKANFLDSLIMSGLIGFITFVIMSKTELLFVFNVIIAVLVGMIGMRFRIKLDLIPIISIAAAVVALFVYLDNAYHHISFHITRFIIFNISLIQFTVIYGIFAAFTLAIPFFMTKVNRTVFSVIMIAYSFGLATMEYICASRRNGIFYNDMYCVFTAIMLSLVAYLMLKTKKIYLTSFAVVVSFQIAKLSMFIFPRYLSIIAIAIYLSTIIIRQSYHYNLETDSVYFIVNQVWNALSSIIVSATFASTLHIIFFARAPTFFQTLLEAAFLMCVLMTHECYVLNHKWFAIPFTGCFISALAVLLSLGLSSSIDQIFLFFIIAALLFTSSKDNYTIGRNFLTRFIFVVSVSILLSHYLFGFIQMTSFWFYFILLIPTLLGLFVVGESICVTETTVRFILPAYVVLVLTFPLSFAAAVIQTRNIIYLRSIASVIFSLHFILHVAILIGSNISKKAMIRMCYFNTFITYVSAPLSIIMGIILHYHILNGSSIVVLLFIPLMELIITDKCKELDEYQKSGVTILGTLVAIPFVTLTSMFKYGFSVDVLIAYILSGFLGMYILHFASYLLMKKEVFRMPLILSILQFVAAITILIISKNDFMITESLFAAVVVPISVYIRSKKGRNEPQNLVL